MMGTCVTNKHTHTDTHRHTQTHTDTHAHILFFSVWWMIGIQPADMRMRSFLHLLPALMQTWHWCASLVVAALRKVQKCQALSIGNNLESLERIVIIPILDSMYPLFHHQPTGVLNTAQLSPKRPGHGRKHFLVQHESPCPSGKQSLMWGPQATADRRAFQDSSDLNFFFWWNHLFFNPWEDGPGSRWRWKRWERQCWSYREPSTIGHWREDSPRLRTLGIGTFRGNADFGAFYFLMVYNHQTSQELLFHQQRHRGNSCFISANKTRQSVQILRVACLIWSNCALLHAQLDSTSLQSTYRVRQSCVSGGSILRP